MMQAESTHCPCCPLTPHPDNFPVEITTTFDEGKHLSLQQPDNILSLSKDLHYDLKYVSEKLASDFGCTSSFQLLSEEGMAAMDESVNCMEKHALSCARIPRVVRGGSFRSKFLDGLSHSPAILRMVSGLAGCELIPHVMKIHHLHLNFNPLPEGIATEDTEEAVEENVEKEEEERSSHNVIVPRKKQKQEEKFVDKQQLRRQQQKKKRIDKWHCDTTGFVIVLFCTDPALYEGGNLQYFAGTQQEGIDYFKQCRVNGEEYESHTDSRVRSVEGGQRKGSGVFMQGSRVYHQVTPVLKGRDRTTAVFSFQPRNVLALEACDRLAKTYNLVDPLNVFLPDWVRYRAWKMARRIEMFFEHIEAKEQAEASDEINIKSNPESVAQASEAVTSGASSTSTSTSSSGLLPIANRTLHGLMQLARTLRYTDDRTYLTDQLKSVCADLCEEMTHLQLQVGGGKDLCIGDDSSGCVDAASIHVTSSSSSSSISALEHQRMFNTTSQTYGVENFLALRAELDSCVDDVLNLKQVDVMEYF